jgi:phospholipid-translocating ATPase
MYYTDRDQRAVPRSWNIADDLGQIQYIFSDKTGTLTRNVMEFRRCSINGKIYGCLPVHRAQRGLMGHKSQEETGFVSEEGHSQMEADMIEHLGRLLPYKYVPPLELSFVDTALLEDICEQGPDLRGKKVCDFFFMIIVCHTILIDKLGMTEEAVASTEEGLLESDISPHLLQYQAQSPDEAALVKAARDLGFVFLSRDCNYLNLLVLGQPERVEILNVIEFNSTRKRMSVIVRRENGEVWLFCKGADSVIYERLKSCADAMGSCMEAQTLNHLESFAEAGLRTLCFASRKLTEGEYESFALRHQEASMAMSNRELLMDAVAEEYEKELVLAGATAIEDRLQDGVPETISTLQKAGIKIWVLTGDKMETAVNIGFSCQLLRKDMFLIMVRSDDQTVEGTKKQLDEGYRRMLRSLDHLNSENWGAATEPSADGYAEGEGNLEYALIIDGVSLKHALDDRDCRPLFLDLATNCRAVLCCRVSPLQKAKVVELVKRTSNCMTLAIGDGANDVSMIQVGLNREDKEGIDVLTFLCVSLRFVAFFCSFTCRRLMLV